MFVSPVRELLINDCSFEIKARVLIIRRKLFVVICKFNHCEFEFYVNLKLYLNEIALGFYKCSI